MGIKITNSRTKLKKGLALANKISSYIFEEGHGEMELLTETEIKALIRAQNALIKASNRTIKKKKV